MVDSEMETLSYCSFPMFDAVDWDLSDTASEISTSTASSGIYDQDHKKDKKESELYPLRLFEIRNESSKDMTPEFPQTKYKQSTGYFGKLRIFQCLKEYFHQKFQIPNEKQIAELQAEFLGDFSLETFQQADTENEKNNKVIELATAGNTQKNKASNRRKKIFQDKASFDTSKETPKQFRRNNHLESKKTEPVPKSILAVKLIQKPHKQNKSIDLSEKPQLEPPPLFRPTCVAKRKQYEDPLTFCEHEMFDTYWFETAKEIQTEALDIFSVLFYQARRELNFF